MDYIGFQSRNINSTKSNQFELLNLNEEEERFIYIYAQSKRNIVTYYRI